MFRGLIIPALLLSSLIIGAGMFSLPYLFSQAGLIVGFLYLALFALIFSAIHLMYAEIISSTGEDHRFVGYAKKFLGSLGFYASFITTLIGLLATLLIYVALSSSFIQVIAPALGESLSAAIFWAFGAIPVILGIKKISELGFAATVAMIAAIFVIFFYGIRNFELASLGFINPANIFLPYAAVLFSLGGRSAISSIKKYLESANISLKWFNFAIFLGTIIPAILYGLFVIGILGLAGANPSPDSLTGLENLPYGLLSAIAILGIMALWTSYIFLGLEFRGILLKDFNFSALASGLLVTALPIGLYFAGLNDFLILIGVAGGVLLAAESILVVLMWLKIKNRSAILKILSYLLMAVFILGAIYEISKIL